MTLKVIGQAVMCRFLTIGFIVLLCPGGLPAQEDENGVSVLTTPYYTREQVEEAAAEIPPVRFQAPSDRWARLPRTSAVLGRGRGELRVVMLGDSIVNDTSQSRWDDVLQGMYPGCKVTKVACVRGSTGCWWYKEPGRVKRYVLDLNPDLLIIGGISHKDDTESVREVIRQVRAGSGCDILLITGAFGHVDPNDDMQWSFAVDPTGKDYRARLRRVADDEKTAFFDMTAYWGKYVRESGKDVTWFKRDAVHANERGMQVIGRLLAGYLAPPAVGDSETWLITPQGWHDLTSRQRRKPLLGSGAAVPVPFLHRSPGGVLVVGSDGLFKYAGADLIRDTARRGTPGEACQALIDLVRLPNGTLQDDVAVVVCRIPRPEGEPAGTVVR